MALLLGSFVLGDFDSSSDEVHLLDIGLGHLGVGVVVGPLVECLVGAVEGGFDEFPDNHGLLVQSLLMDLLHGIEGQPVIVLGLVGQLINEAQTLIDR